MLIMADFIPFGARKADKGRSAVSIASCNVIKDNANELKLNGKKKQKLKGKRSEK